MELERVIDRWHSQQKAKVHYGWHLLVSAVGVVSGAWLFILDLGSSWSITLIICALVYAAIQHLLVEEFVHHTYPVPDELLLMIAGEPALSDNLKRQLASALNAESVITFGELRELGWQIEREDLKANTRTQDGFRKLTGDYPASTVESVP